MAALHSILPVLNSKSEPPPLFDGTSRLYVSLTCPYAQRVWIARNYKGLNQIQIVPIDLQDRPAWYKEKVYPANKVPSLEHNGKVTGESLDLLDYLDNNFEGPKLFPMDPEKKKAANELLKYTDTLTKNAFIAFSKPDSEVVQETGPAFDYLESALGKFADGPFFLGQFSVVDIAYAPFVERFQIVFPRFKNYDITDNRPKLLKWIEVCASTVNVSNGILVRTLELHKIDAYTTTKADPEKIVETYKKRLVSRL